MTASTSSGSRSCPANDRRHHAQVRRAGQPVQQRHAVEQDAERKRAEQEVLDRRFVRPLVRLDEAGQDVERDRHRLEADEDGDEIDAAGHDHHAERRAQDQEVVLARAGALRPRGSAPTSARSCAAATRNTTLKNSANRSTAIRPLRDLDVRVDERHQRDQRRAEHRHRHPRQHARLPRGSSDVGDQHEQRAGREHDLRQDVVEVAERQCLAASAASPAGRWRQRLAVRSARHRGEELRGGVRRPRELAACGVGSHSASVCAYCGLTRAMTRCTDVSSRSQERRRIEADPDARTMQRRERRELAQVQVGQLLVLRVLDLAEHRPLVQPQHVGGAEHDAARGERRPHLAARRTRPAGSGTRR